MLSSSDVRRKAASSASRDAHGEDAGALYAPPRQFTDYAGATAQTEASHDVNAEINKINPSAEGPPPGPWRAARCRTQDAELVGHARNLVLRRRASAALYRAAQETGEARIKDLLKKRARRIASCQAAHADTLVLFSRDLQRSGETGRHRALSESGKRVCGVAVGCPVCNASQALQRLQRVYRGVLDHQALGEHRHVLCVAWTVPHTADAPWHEVLRLLKGTKRTLFRDSGDWLRRELGFVGCVTSTEETVGRNGLHPHTHDLFFIERELPYGMRPHVEVKPDEMTPVMWTDLSSWLEAKQAFELDMSRKLFSRWETTMRAVVKRERDKYRAGIVSIRKKIDRMYGEERERRAPALKEQLAQMVANGEPFQWLDIADVAMLKEPELVKGEKDGVERHAIKGAVVAEVITGDGEAAARYVAKDAVASAVNKRGKRGGRNWTELLLDGSVQSQKDFVRLVQVKRGSQSFSVSNAPRGAMRQVVKRTADGSEVMKEVRFRGDFLEWLRAQVEDTLSEEEREAVQEKADALVFKAERKAIGKLSRAEYELLRTERAALWAKLKDEFERAEAAPNMEELTHGVVEPVTEEEAERILTAQAQRLEEGRVSMENKRSARSARETADEYDDVSWQARVKKRLIEFDIRNGHTERNEL